MILSKLFKRDSLVAAVLAVSVLLPAAVRGGDPVDQIVAVVDEKPILESQLREELDVFRAEPSMKSLPPDELRSLALDKLVGDHLILAKAKAEDMLPSGDDVEEALETSIQRMRSQFPDESSFRSALEAEGISLDDLRKRYREEVEKTLTIRMIVDRLIRPGIEINDAQVRLFYDENFDKLPTFPARYQLAQIFFEPEASAAGESASRRELLELKERALAGEDFSELAKAHSDGPSSTVGGDLGFFGRGDMVGAFDDAAFALETPLEVSDVVSTPFGLHIIQLVERDGDRVRVRHILKKSGTGEAERGSARVEAEAIRESLSAGGEFERLAAAYSDDPSSAARGGEIGTFATDDVSPEVNDALNAITEGEITDVVEAEDGYHIFKLLGRFPAGKPSLEEAYEDIRAAAGQAKQQEAYEEYIEGLKKEIYVRIL